LAVRRQNPSNAMKSTRQHAMVFVTIPDVKTGRRLAQAALEKRLVACANLIPKIESHYWWQGKIQSGGEGQLIFKTQRRLLARLEECIRATHPYETPEFLVVPIQAGAERYLDWLDESVASPSGP
jgi:periplasmic divalent cation tolerance protein